MAILLFYVAGEVVYDSIIQNKSKIKSYWEQLMLAAELANQRTPTKSFTHHTPSYTQTPTKTPAAAPQAPPAPSAPQAPPAPPAPHHVVSPDLSEAEFYDALSHVSAAQVIYMYNYQRYTYYTSTFLPFFVRDNLNFILETYFLTDHKTNVRYLNTILDIPKNCNFSFENIVHEFQISYLNSRKCETATRIFMILHLDALSFSYNIYILLNMLFI